MSNMGESSGEWSDSSSRQTSEQAHDDEGIVLSIAQQRFADQVVNALDMTRDLVIEGMRSVHVERMCSESNSKAGIDARDAKIELLQAEVASMRVAMEDSAKRIVRSSAAETQQSAGTFDTIPDTETAARSTEELRRANDRIANLKTLMNDSMRQKQVAESRCERLELSMATLSGKGGFEQMRQSQGQMDQFETSIREKDSVIYELSEENNVLRAENQQLLNQNHTFRLANPHL